MVERFQRAVIVARGLKATSICISCGCRVISLVAVRLSRPSLFWASVEAARHSRSQCARVFVASRLSRYVSLCFVFFSLLFVFSSPLCLSSRTAGASHIGNSLVVVCVVGSGCTCVVLCASWCSATCRVFVCLRSSFCVDVGGGRSCAQCLYCLSSAAVEKGNTRTE